jgi:hypothetical protein
MVEQEEASREETRTGRWVPAVTTLRRWVPRAASWVLPHGVVLLRWHLIAESRARDLRVKRARLKPWGAPSCGFGYDAALGFLASLGVDREQAHQASVPEASLGYCCSFLPSEGPARPLLGLQVGTFVGLSLAYLTHRLREVHPHSRLFAIDPNVPHRGVMDPQAVVIKLLARFGLQGNVVLLTGYSLEKNLSNDTFEFAGYDPIAHSADEQSCEGQLLALSLLAPESFDFVLVDGNHDAAYLSREMAILERLVRPGGLVFLDDVTDAWVDIRRVYQTLDEGAFQRLGCDGRVGVLRKRAAR